MRAIDRSWADCTTVPVCEDEGSLLPSLAGLPIPALTLTPLLKRAPRQPREIYRPPTLFGLRWSKQEADSRLPLQRVPHGQQSCVEIDVLPLQPQRLPYPQAAGSKQHPERLPPTAVRATTQLLKLGHGQGGHRAPHPPRGTDQLARIAS